MPSAELNIKTTHDGTQAERSIDRLQNKISQFGDAVSSKIGNKLLSIFSAGAVIAYAKAVSETVNEIGKLVDKVRDGTASIKDLKKEAGMDPGHVGSLAGMAEADKLSQRQNKNAMGFMARFFYGILGSVIPYGGGAHFDPNFETKRAHALFGDLGTLGVAEMQGKLKNQRASKEAARQQAIKELIDREYGPAEGRNVFTEMAPITGRYFGPGIPDYQTQRAQQAVEIEKRQLDALNKIMRILDQGPSSGGGTAFPR